MAFLKFLIGITQFLKKGILMVLFYCLKILFYDKTHFFKFDF
ncbi:hypothetical protein OUK_1115 [Helicobacter pylori R037c]|nr:hypothetical protein OUK_1115 [Helicobacter pylori R037c]